MNRGVPPPPPPPPPDVIPELAYHAYFGRKAAKWLRARRRLEHQFWMWSWAGCCGGPVWLAWRGMWGWSGTLLAVQALLLIFTGWWPAMLLSHPLLGALGVRMALRHAESQIDEAESLGLSVDDTLAEQRLLGRPSRLGAGIALAIELLTLLAGLLWGPGWPSSWTA